LKGLGNSKVITKKRETHHHGYLPKSNNYAYITEIRLLDEAVVLIVDINLEKYGRKEHYRN
jgi:hypothetical protein